MSQELQRVSVSSVALPAFVDKGDKSGTEEIRKTDLILPRLSLAQGTSPELDETNSKYIPGLKLMDAFNTVSGQVYGKEPIDVVIIRVEPPRFMEFHKVEGGGLGGVKDFRVPENDPRTQWQGNEKPLATKFLEYVAFLLPTRKGIAERELKGIAERELIMLSFKSKGLSTARTINTILNSRKAPAFASRFRLTPGMETAANGKKYAAFSATFLGNVDEETYRAAKEAFEGIKGQVAETDREADDHAGKSDEDVPF